MGAVDDFLSGGNDQKKQSAVDTFLAGDSKATPGIPTSDMMPSHTPGANVMGDAPEKSYLERVVDPENMKEYNKWSKTETPESKDNADWLTRVVPTSFAKNATQAPQAAFEMGKRMVDPYIEAGKNISDGQPIVDSLAQGAIGSLKATGENIKDAGKFIGTKLGIISPDEEGIHPVLPLTDEWGKRFKHQVRTDPFGVVMAAEGARPVARGIVKGVASIPPEAGAASLNSAASKLTDMTLKQSTTLKPEIRARNVKTALEGGFLPSEAGVGKLDAAISQNETALQEMINKGSAKGVKTTLDTAISNLEALKEDAKFTSDPAGNLKLIESEIEALKNHPLLDESGKVDMAELQKMKVTQGREITNKYVSREGQTSTFQDDIDKARVRGFKEGLENTFDELFPESAGDLKGTNKQLSEFYQLKKQLVRAANRISNREGIGISLPIKSGAGAAVGSMVGGPVGAAILGGIGTLIGIIEHPRVAPRLARQLYNASKGIDGGIKTYADALAVTKQRLDGLKTKINERGVIDLGQELPPDNPDLYDPSQRTPGEATMQIDRSATPGNEQPYGELELRPGATGESPPLVPTARSAEPNPLIKPVGTVPNLERNDAIPSQTAPVPNPRKPLPGQGVTERAVGASTQGDSRYSPEMYQPVDDLNNNPSIYPGAAKAGRISSIQTGPQEIELTLPESPAAETPASTPTPPGPDFKYILESLDRQTGIVRGKGRKHFTDSDFRNYLKQNYPTVAARYAKSDIIGALETQSRGERLGRHQQRIIDAFTEDDKALQAQNAPDMEHINEKAALYAQEAKMNMSGWSDADKVDFVNKYESYKGGPGFAEGGMVTNGLRPSLIFQGKQIDGAPDQTHVDLMKENEIGSKQPHDRGFVAPSGVFMTRDQAADWLRVERPEIYAEWQKLGNPELHTQDLMEAIKNHDSESRKTEKKAKVKPVKKQWKGRVIGPELTGEA